jgi:hypothetical protein
MSRVTTRVTRRVIAVRSARARARARGVNLPILISTASTGTGTNAALGTELLLEAAHVVKLLAVVVVVALLESTCP